MSTTVPAADRGLLADPDRLARALASDGVVGVAAQVGCSPRWVRACARRHGIPPVGAGRRRGQAAVTLAARPADKPLLAALIETLDRDRRHREPATLRHVARRVHALHDAATHGAPSTIDDALLDVASIALLTVEHNAALRRAA